MEGSYALRSQAQQQAALELLQARKLGCDDNLLEDVLRTRIHDSIAQVLRETPVQSIPPSLQPEPESSLQERVAIFLRADSEHFFVMLEGDF
jgi:hypothetical protein